MERERYFILTSFPLIVEMRSLEPMDSEYVLAELDGLTEDEANAVAVATSEEGRESQAEVWCMSETESRKDPIRHLIRRGKAAEVLDHLRKLHTVEGSPDLFYRLAEYATQFGERLRNADPPSKTCESPKHFEVFDEDTGQSVVFDTMDTTRWGPVYYDDSWNGDYWDYQVEETLYRHASGHWTLISERTHCEAPCGCGLEAKRLDDKEAARWLVRHEQALPADLEALFRPTFFAPGPPAPTVTTDAERIAPAWNPTLGELRYDGTIIRRVQRGRAKNIVKILDAFQEEGWPDRIDDPLAPSKDQQRLHETISSLNDNIDPPLIRFRADGTGQGIVWEAISQKPPRENPDIPF